MENFPNHAQRIQKNHASVVKLWERFVEAHPEYPVKTLPDVFYFSDNQTDADELAELVVQGVKQATATSLWWFETQNEKLPKPGDPHVVIDWNGNAKAVIETTKIELVPFKNVSEAFAHTEGEGDKSLAYWRRVHMLYYTNEMKPYGETFHEDMVIVCEYFKTIYT